MKYLNYLNRFNSIDNFFIKFNSTFSPALLFLCCYLNGCLAHNIYLTYYDYRKSYEKRIKLYRISALVISGLIYMITLVNLDFNNFYTLKNLSMTNVNEYKNITKVESLTENIFDKNLRLLTENEVKMVDNMHKIYHFFCFKENYTIIYYLISITILAYISHHLYYIVNKDHDYISFADGKLNLI